jgi:hypothetical protein
VDYRSIQSAQYHAKVRNRAFCAFAVLREILAEKSGARRDFGTKTEKLDRIDNSARTSDYVNDIFASIHYLRSRMLHSKFEAQKGGSLFPFEFEVDSFDYSSIGLKLKQKAANIAHRNISTTPPSYYSTQQSNASVNKANTFLTSP